MAQGRGISLNPTVIHPEMREVDLEFLKGMRGMLIFGITVSVQVINLLFNYVTSFFKC